MTSVASDIALSVAAAPARRIRAPAEPVTEKYARHESRRTARTRRGVSVDLGAWITVGQDAAVLAGAARLGTERTKWIVTSGPGSLRPEC
jgi:hypothetical protein